jgi:hypothetical protein
MSENIELIDLIEKQIGTYSTELTRSIAKNIVNIIESTFNKGLEYDELKKKYDRLVNELEMERERGDELRVKLNSLFRKD